ncbi:MAG: PHP domain-containing protein, partial [Defluviitaleaceae bacterium]|nr:PHP domain-containing protein [Defluviitaleaceae bacterium]
MARVGEYRVYYGLLHAHSNMSDGKGSPVKAYQCAKDAGLDFFALADHNNCFNGVWDVGWPAQAMGELVNAAQAAYEPGRFATLVGFEMTSWQMGHITVVYNPDGGLNTAQNYFFNPMDIGVDTLDKFYQWLDTQPAVGFFNHPGDYVWDTWYPSETWGPEFNFFNPINGFTTDRMVGMELFNRNAAFETYFYSYRFGDFRDRLNPGDRVQLRANTFLDEANQQGWRIGAAGSDDHHGMGWGTMNDFRMAILAPELTRDALFYAMENRRFYSTLDSNLALSFTIGGHE